MKRVLKIISVLLVLAIALSACGKAAEEENGFNYSASFSDNGYWKDITATEYVTLPDFEKIELKQADLDDQIQYLLEKYHDDVEVMDREVKNGDTLNIDYVGSVDGVEFEGGNTNGNGTEVTIGVTSYIDGFLDQLIGHKPGETFDINVTFPDPYTNNTELSGKDAVFKITINKIIEHVDGTWNDEFVNKNFAEERGWTTVAQAEAGLKSYLVEQYLYDNTKFEKDVPESMMDFQKNSAIAYYQNYADAYNMSLEDFLKYYVGKNSVDELWDSVKGESETYSKYYLIYQALAEKTGFEVSEDDVKAYFENLGKADRYEESIKTYGLPYVKFMILTEKIMEKISANATMVK